LFDSYYIHAIIVPFEVLNFLRRFVVIAFNFKWTNSSSNIVLNVFVVLIFQGGTNYLVHHKIERWTSNLPWKEYMDMDACETRNLNYYGIRYNEEHPHLIFAC
jgi:hypothetical protein